jgi:myosin heavy subunit
LEQQILKSNPVMEAFGNAKTVRNNNSSRFGKWTEINFNQTGAIIGGSIINYLLEKSRIPFQASGERNYHVFYQLLAGGEVYPDIKARLQLKEAEEYHYLNQSGVTTVENINDEKDYEEMTTALGVLNMTADETTNILKLVSAILHMGNVEFVPNADGESVKIKNTAQVDLVASQLGVDNAGLAKALVCKNIGGKREVIYVQYNMNQASDARDGLAKALYGEMFNWLIEKINLALTAKMAATASASGKEKHTTIGVLDIFGFESFVKNSFEQLCINYCNEKLQFHFNEHIFKLEQAEYASEGITVEHIEFTDNQACLDLLEMKATGIFAMIDEEINVPRGSDEGFRSKVATKHGKVCVCVRACVC